MTRFTGFEIRLAADQFLAVFDDVQPARPVAAFAPHVRQFRRGFQTPETARLPVPRGVADKAAFDLPLRQLAGHQFDGTVRSRLARLFNKALVLFCVTFRATAGADIGVALRLAGGGRNLCRKRQADEADERGEDRDRGGSPSPAAGDGSLGDKCVKKAFHKADSAHDDSLASDCRPLAAVPHGIPGGIPGGIPAIRYPNSKGGPDPLFHETGAGAFP